MQEDPVTGQKSTDVATKAKSLSWVTSVTRDSIDLGERKFASGNCACDCQCSDIRRHKKRDGSL